MKIIASEIDVIISSALDNLDLIQALTDCITGYMCFDEDSAHWIGMSVREAVTNAIQHGNRWDINKRVYICFAAAPDRLSITVRDQGNGFRADAIPSPLNSDNLLKPSGRGIFYIRTFMDEVEFRAPSQGGTEVFMAKKLSSNLRRSSMKIETRIIGDVRILDCSGKITLGEGTMAVRNTVRDILKNNGKKIILNLADVNYIDSSGIGELVSTYTTVTNNGGQLILLNLTKKIQELIAITKLLTVFQVFDSEQAALAGFSKS